MVHKPCIAHFLFSHPVWQLPYVSSFHTVLLEAALRVFFFMGQVMGFGFIFAAGKNKGFAPSSRREQQSTGLLHLMVRIPVMIKEEYHLVLLFLWGG